MFSRHFANLMSNCGRLCVALVSTSNAATTTVTTTTVTTTSAVSPTVETTTTTTTTNNKNDERLNANDIIDDDNYNYNNSNRNFYNYFSNSNNNDNNNNFNNNFNSIGSNSNNNNDNSISPTAIPFPPPSGKHLDDKIAIIGGGWSGLAVLKELKAYGFRNIRLLESHEDIGGQWNINNPETQTWSNVRANISKMNMHYPDYPYPIDPKEPLHCTIGELHQYLHNYANEFNLFPNIQFHSRVNAIEPIDPNDTAASKWNVRYIRTDVDKNKEVVETFDRVVVCTGRFGQPRAAPLPGNYTGEIKKLTDIKSTNFTGKKLVVIGNSISAIDVMELACLNGAYDITCVYRTPRWYVSMWLPDGTPFEQSSRKYGDLDLLRKRMDKGSIQLTRYGFVKPNVKDVESGKLKTGISLCRSFEYWVKKGRIRGCHGSIVNCEGKNITLSNGTTLEGVDMILLTTGFDPNVPVLPRDLFSHIYRPELKERRFLLYLLTFIPGWYNQSLAFVGIQPIVESNPTMFELQARMIGHYWSAGGSLALPHKTPEAQNKWIEKNIVKLDYSPLLPDIARQSYHIADEIADFIGCRPTDAELVNLLEDAGFIPEQYRIVGPHKNEKAYARMKWKLENRFKDTPENMLKHIRLVGKVSPAKLYLQKYIFTGIRPLLTRQDKKSQRRNREKYEQELQREREEEERLLREQENQQKSG